VCCSVLQCVAVCCSVLQCVAVCCSVLQCVAVCCRWCSHMGWLQLVGSLKLKVSFAKEPYKTDDILQKRPTILRSLLIVATPYTQTHANERSYRHRHMRINILENECEKDFVNVKSDGCMWKEIYKCEKRFVNVKRDV